MPNIRVMLWAALAATLFLVAGKLGSDEWRKVLPEIAASAQAAGH